MTAVGSDLEVGDGEDVVHGQHRLGGVEGDDLLELLLLRAGREALQALDLQRLDQLVAHRREVHVAEVTGGAAGLANRRNVRVSVAIFCRSSSKASLSSNLSCVTAPTVRGPVSFTRPGATCSVAWG